MRRSIGVAGTLWLTLVSGALAASDEPGRLPSDVVPSHYDLLISPDAQALTFTGRVKIDVTVRAPVRTITLNQKGLTLDSVSLDGRRPQSVTKDETAERASLLFAQSLPAGRHSLTIAYHGPIGQGTFGFFAMDYDSANGKRRTLATNFEPTGARMLLPCWDEPGRKATFSVTLDAPTDEMAVANMPVAAVTAAPAGGMKRVRFAATPPMSTYLLFLTEGDYERIHAPADGVDVGVVVKRGDTARAAYALDQARALLRYYDDWFGVRFPLPKLDLVAAPGQITGGSMENWGSIFYSQDHLLFDSADGTEADRQLVFLVVGHEMAHQWFGDLVTMAWWDNLWLNEGFARWMQTHAADALHPQWRTGLQAQSIFEGGKRADSKPSTHPILQPVASAAQAEEAFDEITYDKGAAVISMLEAFAGPDAFRDGVRRYMRAHAFGNSVDADLWSQVDTTSGKPVSAVEQDFVRQAGLPLIEVAAASGGASLSVGRFREDPAADPAAATPTWRIPLTVSAPPAPDLQAVLNVRATLENAVAAAPAAVFNAGATTYARVAYPPERVRALAGRFGALPAIDQLNLINDAWALGQAGYRPARDAAAYVSALPPTADLIVWRRATRLLVEIDQDHEPGDARETFRRFALAALAPVADRLGPDARPGEDGAASELRDALWQAQASFGDRAAIARARAVFASSAPGAASPELRRTALSVVGATADPATFDLLLARAKAASDPLERSRILEAMALVRDPALSSRFVAIALGPLAPAGTAPGLIEQAANVNPDAVWPVLLARADDPNLPIDAFVRPLLFSGVAGGSSRPERARELEAWAHSHVPADARRPVVAAVAQIGLNARIRAQAVRDIDAWVAERH
ncbi:MAG TPA: M1 family metallopeptidase [Caulobacteraceae bacterium]